MDQNAVKHEGDLVGPVNGVLLLAFEVLASILLVATVWIVDYLPTHDGPHHIYLAHVGNRFADASTSFSLFYEPGRPLTALGFDLLFGPLESLLPWRDALRVTLSITLLVWAWGARTLIVSVHPGRRPLGLLAFAAALQWSLYMGFFSYLLATGLGFFVLAFAIRCWPWSWKRGLLLASLLSLQAVAHVFCAAITGLVLLLFVIFRSEHGDRVRNFLKVVVIGAPTIGIAAYTTNLLSDPAHAETLGALGSTWPTWLKRFSYLAYLHVPGPVWKAWPLVILAVVGLIDGTRRACARDPRPLDRPFAIATLLLLLAALLLPLHIHGRWEFLSPRSLPVGIILGISLLGFERLPKLWNRLATTATAALVAASLLWAVWLHRGIERVCGDALAGLDARFERRGVRLPIILDTKCGAHPFLLENNVFWVEPLLNIGAIYAVQQGGVVPYVFALQPQIHPFVVTSETVKAYPRVPDRRKYWNRTKSAMGPERVLLLQDLASHASAFEDVILFGTPDDVEQFIRWGFVPDAQHGSLLVGRYEGCPTSLRILLPAGKEGRLEVAWGWGLLEKMRWGANREVEPREKEMDLVVPLPNIPCGDTRLLVRFVEGEAGPLELMVCEGSSAPGIRMVTTSRETKILSCVLR